MKRERKWTFSIRTLLIAVTIASALALAWTLRNGINTTTARVSVQSPDKQKTLVIETRVHRPLLKNVEFTSINTKIFRPNGKIYFFRSHAIDPLTTKSLIPANYNQLDPSCVNWSADSKIVTYPITDQESVTIEIDTGDTFIHDTNTGNGG